MGSILSPIIAKDNPLTIEHSARTAIAAVVSLFVARWFGLSESYWAAITTLVVMQSTLGAALPASGQRLAGTALGATVGASGRHVLSRQCFGLRRLHLIRLERNAYRYAGITLAIIMLVPGHSGWIVALHPVL
jgi:Fusaric acid resistance protein family